MSLTLRGLYPALPLPLDASLNFLDREFTVHVQRMARIGKVAGVVVNGHAGEVASLSDKERKQVVEVAAGAAPRGFPVVAGVEASSTEQAVGRAQDARDAGADALLVLPPFEALALRSGAKDPDVCREFFTDVAASVDVPIIVFQYPHWTGVSYPTECLVEIAAIDQVIGVKNAVWRVEDYIEQYHAVKGKAATLAACDGPELIAMMMAGADGALLGISNVGTALWADFVDGCLAGDYERVAPVFFNQLHPLAHSVFGDIERGEGGFVRRTKEALVQLGLFSTARVRPPQPQTTGDEQSRVKETLVSTGLLPGG